MRSLFALLLSLVLAVSSVGMAVARGQAPMSAVQTLTLCTSTGVQDVALDAQGNPVPVGGVHICPDCLAGVFALDLAGTSPLAPRPMGRETRVTLPESRCLASLTLGLAHARDPPPLI